MKTCTHTHYIETNHITIDCLAEANTILIYGCLEYHIKDRTLCTQHLVHWLQQKYAHATYCDCGLPIEDYITQYIG